MSNVVFLLYDIVVHVDHENRMILMRRMAHHQIQIQSP